MDLYRKILKLDFENIDAINSLAQCLRANLNGNPAVLAEVFALYQQAITIDPEDFETNFNLGVLYFEHKKDYDKAIDHLRTAINEEENATACFNLAIIHDEKGQS